MHRCEPFKSQDRYENRLVLNDLVKDAQEAVVKEFVDAILDLAGVSRALKAGFLLKGGNIIVPRHATYHILPTK